MVEGEPASALSAEEAAVARYARALSVDARISDATYQAVAGTMDARQIVELTLLAGLYRLVACVANGLKVDLDGDAARALDQFRSESV